jgi:hypothetical protein
MSIGGPIVLAWTITILPSGVRNKCCADPPVLNVSGDKLLIVPQVLSGTVVPKLAIEEGTHMRI